MANLQHLITAPALLSLLCALPAQAGDSVSINASLRAGLEQQSNVNISELSQASGQSDVATLLEADANVQWQTSAAVSLAAGYSVQDKNYRQAEAFNSRLQLAHLDLSYQRGQHTFGTNLYYAIADLDQARFLTLQQASLYSMHSIGDSSFVRPALTLSEKTFARLSERDANNGTASIDAYWFFAQATRFITFGLRYEEENSRDTAFSYRAPGLNIRFSATFPLWQLEQKVQLGARWSQRRYTETETDAIAPTVNRRDNQSQFDASWQLTLSENLATIAKLQHGDFSSTLDSADYQETRSSLMLQLSF